MKLLLSCDDFLYSHQGEYYASSQEKFDFYQRYLRVFDKLRLVCRCEEKDQLKASYVCLSKDSRIEVVSVPMFHGPKQYMKKYLSVGISIKNIVKDCDAAVLRIPSTIAMRIGKQVMKSNLPYACEVVYDGEDGWKVTTGITRLLWKNIDRKMRKLCKLADGVSCVTERYLQQHYYSEIPHAFTSHYSSLALNKDFYTSPKSYPNHRPIVIAHVTNQIGYRKRKGNLELIKAISILKGFGIDARVKFVGEIRDNSPEKVKKFASQFGVEDSIEFLGYINRKELDDFLNNVDLFVLPTKAEGLPRVIIEAMAKGLPTITTPVSGCPELISEHFLVDYDNVQGLAERIKELVENPQLYVQTSKENFDKSWQYEASVLEKRRDEFYMKLRNVAANRNRKTDYSYDNRHF